MVHRVIIRNRDPEKHHCNAACNLAKNNKVRCCNKKCSLIYPHLNREHNCGNQHYCNEECYLKNDSLGCKMKCKEVYNHKGNHICDAEHFCKNDCYLSELIKVEDYSFYLLLAKVNN